MILRYINFFPIHYIYIDIYIYIVPLENFKEIPHKNMTMCVSFLYLILFINLKMLDSKRFTL